MNKVHYATFWRWLTGIAMGIVLMSPSGAEAYTYLTCHADCWFCDDINDPYRWYGNPVFDVHTGTMGSGTSCSEWTTSTYRNDFNCALKAWSDVGSSYLAPTQRDDNHFEIDDSSDESDVSFLGSGYFDSETLAYTWANGTCDCCFNPTIDEADIAFNSGSSWVKGPVAPSQSNYFGSNNVFRVVALHEIGHALGLALELGGVNNHENVELATMNSKHPSGGWYLGQSYNSNTEYYGRMWPHADDAQGMHYLYPATNVGRDLAMSRSKVGTGGQAIDLAHVFPDIICPGGYISIQHTYENRGNESVSTKIKFYFSTNKNITTSDTASVTVLIINPSAYYAQTVTSSVQVPSGLSPGSYYVGAVIDPDDAVTSEQDESYNNRLQVRVGSGTNEILTVDSCP